MEILGQESRLLVEGFLNLWIASAKALSEAQLISVLELYGVSSSSAAGNGSSRQR